MLPPKNGTGYSNQESPSAKICSGTNDPLFFGRWLSAGCLEACRPWPPGAAPFHDCHRGLVFANTARALVALFLSQFLALGSDRRRRGRRRRGFVNGLGGQHRLFCLRQCPGFREGDGSTVGDNSLDARHGRLPGARLGRSRLPGLPGLAGLLAFCCARHALSRFATVHFSKHAEVVRRRACTLSLSLYRKRAQASLKALEGLIRWHGHMTSLPSSSTT